MSIERVEESTGHAAGQHGRLSPGYLAEILSLATSSPEEAAAEARHGRLAPDYPPEAAPVPSPPAAAPEPAHGRLAAGYKQAVAEFLADR